MRATMTREPDDDVRWQRRARPSPHHVSLDAQRLAWLQATAGNTAVAALVAAAPRALAVQRCGTIPPNRCPCHGGGDEEGAVAVQRHDGESGGVPLTETPATSPGVFPRAVLNRFSAAVTSGDEGAALQTIVSAMIARGELDRRFLTTRATESRAAACATDEAIRLDPSMRWALVTPCGCIDEDHLPNPRLQVHPDLVRASVIGPGRTAHDDAASRLHSVLIHEFRHIRQDAEACATGSREQGMCTDCNSPKEMDAYLAEVEAAHHLDSVRRAWARVVGNWDYLSDEQRTTFTARRDAARTRVDRMFPRVDWDNDPQVAAARRHCERLGAQLPGGADQHGSCASTT